MLRDAFVRLEQALLPALERHYGERLVSVVLFGSVARGTAGPTSDMDLLVVADGLAQGRMKRSADFSAVEDAVEPLLVSLREKGIHTRLSPVLKTKEEASGGNILYIDLVEDARVLFDRDGFFEQILARLRRRLSELGARRVWIGSAWYWDLKPDFKPGEVFEL